MTATSEPVAIVERPVRSLVLTGFGINCEEEMAAAYRLAGGQAEVVHLNAVLHGHVRLDDWDVLNFPGGFSFGDDLGAGRALANKVRFRRLPTGATLLDELQRFIARGGYVVGVCNGFQALVKLGLLPNVGGSYLQEVTLTTNEPGGRFEDRWCHCRVRPGNPSPFFAGLTQLDLPVRHKEGRLVIATPALREAIVERGLVCLTYCTTDGQPATTYPELPNGSDLACAALTDPSGHVLGLMPHPEAFLSRYNHPDWPRIRRASATAGASDDGAGLALFRNIVSHVKRERLACAQSDQERSRS